MYNNYYTQRNPETPLPQESTEEKTGCGCGCGGHGKGKGKANWKMLVAIVALLFMISGVVNFIKNLVK